EDVITEELERIAVIGVGSGLDGGVNDTAVIVAEFSGSVLINDIELANRVGRRGEPQKVIRGLVVVNSIQQEIVGLLPVAIDVRAPSLFRSVRPLIHAGRVNRNCPRREQS